MSTVVVTGAAGFLGSHLVGRLLRAGDRVIAVDDLSCGRKEALGPYRGDARFRFVEADVSASPRLLARALGNERVDRVYHMASPASPPAYMRLPVETMRTGSLGTENMLDLARRHDARFLLASTSEVYGDPTVSPQQEQYRGNVDPVGPRSVYDEAKRYAESLTMTYHRVYGVEVRIPRIFNTYGPGMRDDDGRAVPNFIAQAKAGRPLTIHGDGKQTRSFCYVDDLLRGLVMLMEKGDGRPTNLGNPEEVTILDVAMRIVALCGSHSRLRFLPLPQDDPLQRRPDITRAREKLGWTPQVPLDEGLRRTVAAAPEQVAEVVS